MLMVVAMGRWSEEDGWRGLPVDFLCGCFGGLVYAGSLLLQKLSEVALEYALIALPIVIFPALTWWRASKSGSPASTFAAINMWLVGAYLWLGWLTSAGIRGLVAPLLIGMAASVVATARRVGIRSLAGLVLVAGVAGGLAAPHIWGAMLTTAERTKAPDVTFRSLDGRSFRLRDLRGHVVVLNFWGVWCGPCVEELPALAAFAQTPQARSGRVLAVNSGIGGESAEDIAGFVRAHHLRVPVVLDPDRVAYRAFAVHALPTTIVIDAEGVARFRRVGFAATADYGGWLTRAVRSLEKSE
jgi:thiol-disulfide isomerase/thioredoxin